MKTKSIHARAASEIRKELKKQFPGIKFTVRSESYSGGSSIRVRWEDGPTIDSIDKIINKYQYGSFDGMTDMYNHDNVNNDISQVKYVFANRDLSDKTMEDLRKEIENKYDIDFEDTYGVFEIFRCWPNELLYRESRDRVFN
jgi:hypothetical protein